MRKKCLKRWTEPMLVAAILLLKDACFGPITGRNRGNQANPVNSEREAQNAEQASQSLLTSAATIPRTTNSFALCFLLFALFVSLSSTLAAVVNYDIVPTQHITASVADVQGNTNVVTVRFRVDAGFRILSLDASGLNSQRLTLRFENPSGATNHVVLCVDDLAKPAGAWTTLNQLNAADESNQARRLEVELPSGVQGSLFLRVQKP
jgi:hypothetical protein